MENTPKKRDYSTEWWKKRNERRRLRYTMDTEHRSKVNAMNRVCYRKYNEPHTRTYATLEEATKLGKEREIFSGDGVVIDRMITLTLSEAAKAFGSYHAIVIARWIRQGRFPRPNLYAMNDTRKIRVYSLDTVMRIVEVLKNQRSGKTYFHSNDIEIVAKLFAVSGQQLNERAMELIEKLRPAVIEDLGEDSVEN